jgi:hypothetical protein
MSTAAARVRKPGPKPLPEEERKRRRKASLDRYTKTEKFRAALKRYKTSEKGRAKAKELWRSEKALETKRRYLKTEKGKQVRAKQVRERRRLIKQAKPGWVNAEQISEVYRNCPKGYWVDHIHPLQGENVCGLHVPWNLQYLPFRENIFKGNKFDGTYNNEQWRIQYAEFTRLGKTDSEVQSRRLPNRSKRPKFR